MSSGASITARSASSVALTIQCAYCLDIHSRTAAKAGATREELVETTLIAAAVRAGGALGHASLALRLFDQQVFSRRSRPGRTYIFEEPEWSY
jgi:AhpD family alkylhydroperoxidase